MEVLVSIFVNESKCAFVSCLTAVVFKREDDVDCLSRKHAIAL
jgi:hypothetical protein